MGQLGCSVGPLPLVSADSLAFKTGIDRDLIHFEGLLPGLTRSVLFVSKGDESEDEDSQRKGKRGKE